MTAPQAAIVARDLLDMAASARDIGRDLVYAAQSLDDAYLGDRDEAQAKAGALALLRSAQEGIADLIKEIEGAA